MCSRMWKSKKKSRVLCLCFKEIDTEGFIIPKVSPIEPGTPVIESQESC